ncbi:MAG: AAA family ATPase [Nevskiales bacterium]
MNDLHDLTLTLKSRFPIVVIHTHEEPRARALLERIVNLEDWPFYTWSVTEGLRRHRFNETPAKTHELCDALKHIAKSQHLAVYVLLDAQPFLADPVNQRLIKQIALDYNKVARTLVLVGQGIELAPDLKRLSASFSLSVPSIDATRNIIKEELQLYQQQSPGQKVRGEPDAALLLVQHLAGMCEEDVRRLARQAIRDDGMITRQDIVRVLRHKQETLDAGGALTLELDCGSFADVGGLANLKRWLELRRAVFVQPKDNLAPPKGILLLGVQGSGKSLAAKAVAGSWGLPLLRLDFGTLYNKYHGETERNLRESLKAAEAMAPCVLWMDEIEKGLAADEGSSDGGVSRRVLGTLLTWMTEHKSRVFLAATANDISALPPELLRKGRFDEIFFVDLPDAPTREAIFRIHLQRRELSPDSFELGVLAQKADGFSGAEIEQAVLSAMYEAAARKEPVKQADIEGELQRTHPLSVVMAEKVQALREWAAGRTVPAN